MLRNIPPDPIAAMNPNRALILSKATCFLIGWMPLAVVANSPGPLLVSEVQTWNEGGLRDHTDRTPDWIELVNLSNKSIELHGYGLSDEMNGEPKWRFPGGSLAPGARVLVFASGAPERATANEHHAPFKLATDGEVVRVTHPEGTPSDTVSVKATTLPDVSQGRPADALENWLFFENPTPNKANQNSIEGYQDIASSVHFSHESGTYTESFSLQLTAEADEEIRFALDGDIPNPQTESAQLYQTPLTVYDRSSEPNGISMIAGTSIANQHTDGWFPPRGLVPKAFIVRARSFKEGLLPGPVSTRTYFVNLNPSAAWRLPVISLTTPPEGLFDEASGIYMLGNVFRDYRAAQPGATLTGHTPANYTQRGTAWERAASFEFFETNGELALREGVGVDIQGQSSRSFRQKSFGLKPRGEDQPSSTFDYPFFPGLERRGLGGERRSFRGLRLRNSGNDWDYTMFRDALCHGLVASLGLDVMTPRPVVVFLNGEFWGLYQLREQGDLESIADHHGLDKELLTMAEGNGTFKEGNPDGMASYRALRQLVERGGLEDPSKYAQVSALMDVDQFLRYQIAEIYLGNADWPHNNIRYWRNSLPLAEAVDRPITHDGRWRWMVFDTDLAYGHPWSGGVAGATLAAAISPTGRPGINAAWSTTLLRGLLENPDFRANFINSIACYLNADFKATLARALLQEMQTAIEPVMPEQLSRWRTCQSSMTVWNSNVRVMEGFARQRPAALRLQCVREFDLEGTAKITIQVEPADAGTVTVHRLILDTATTGVEAPVYPWVGTFFKGLPIRLEVTAQPGYHFAGWEGHEGPDLTVTLTGNAEFQARFERDPSIVLPKITAIQRMGGELRIYFDGAPLSSHRVQWSDDLRTWFDGDNSTTDSNGKAEITLGIPELSRTTRCVRVALLSR
ncbi:MAG: hypothetical protein ACI8T1_002982 [Verrucomicrobiales bacterium]|jgi:hypothetical protein